MSVPWEQSEKGAAALVQHAHAWRTMALEEARLLRAAASAGARVVGPSRRQVRACEGCVTALH